MQDYYIEKDCNDNWTLGKDDKLLLCPVASSPGLSITCGDWCARFRVRFNESNSTDRMATVYQGCINYDTYVAIEDGSDDCQPEEV